MNHAEVARQLTEMYPGLLAEFHRVMAERGLREVTITAVEFLHQPSFAGFELRASDCPPGTAPKTRCVTRPGGGVRCSTNCEPV